MSTTSVSIRLGVEGKAEVKRAFDEVGKAGQDAFRGVATSMDVAGAAADRETQRLQRLAQAAKQAAAADQAQRGFNAVLGVGTGPSKSPRDSAAVFEEAARAAEDLAARTAALRAQIDPLGAAQAKLNAEITEANALFKAGAITATEQAAAHALAQARYDGSAMTCELGRLCAVVIGVSGTGSLVAEQLARLGFGRIILIDFDRVEGKNLNRIVNTRIIDVDRRRLKVDSFAEAIDGYRGPGVAVRVPMSVTTREAIEAAADGDVLFSCVDTLEARQIADLLSAAFLLPLFDVGVVIPVRKDGDGHAIADVCGRIDYVQPGGATLQDRGVYSPADIRAEYLRRSAPDAHRQEVDAGYIRGVVEEAPGVITLNMRAASASVNEFIARAYPYRLDPNARYARTVFSLAACEEDYTGENSFTVAANPLLARGNVEPLLGLAALKRPRKAAA